MLDVSGKKKLIFLLAMYFIGTAQPYIVCGDRPSRETTFLTLGERRVWADMLSENRTEQIPVCLEHAGAEKQDATTGTGGFVVPTKLQIGRITGAFLRGNYDLVLIGEIYWDRPEAQMLIDGIDNNEHWGLSLCTNFLIDKKTWEVSSKKITHVGVTRSPEFGPEGTYIHRAYRSWKSLDQDFHDEYINKENDLYVPEIMLKRLKDRLRQEGKLKIEKKMPILARKPQAGKLNIDTVASNFGGLALCNKLPNQNRDHSFLVAPRSNMAASEEKVATGKVDAIEALQKVQQDMEKDFGPLLKNPDGLNYKMEYIKKAGEYVSQFTDILNASEIGKDYNTIPTDIISSIMGLKKYIDGGKFIMAEYINKTLPDDRDAAEINNRIVSNYNEPNNYSVATQVLASAMKGIHNQRELQQQVDLKQIEYQEKVNALKRDRETLEKEKAEFEESVKKSRTGTKEASNTKLEVDSIASRFVNPAAKLPSNSVRVPFLLEIAGGEKKNRPEYLGDTLSAGVAAQVERITSLMTQ